MEEDARQSMNSVGPARYYKAAPQTMRQLGLNEKWLQDRINEDPSILGLGDVNVVAAERIQSSGGRLDFLLSDPDINTMYEVEVMLGRLDESHIIRTIEYWDIERRRWPTRDHRAVIVAEEITNRFFNVVSLLNRAVPIVAIQLNALQIEDKVVLSFTKVMDIFEDPEEDEEVVGDPANREWWISNTNPESMSVYDGCLELIPAVSTDLKITYNRKHIAVGNWKQNFVWFTPRKQQKHCYVRIRVDEGERDALSDELERAGITARKGKRTGIISMSVTPRELEEQSAVLRNALGKAYDRD